METSRSPQIVGIGGVSNGGKTTLCLSLVEKLRQVGVNVEMLQQDEFFKEVEDIPWHKSGVFRICDDKVAIDMAKMMEAVHSRVAKMQKTNSAQSAPVLLIEGFLLFNYECLNSMFSRRYFFTLPKDIAWKRRLSREYRTPEPAAMFPEHVWPMYLIHYDELKKANVDMVELNGTDSPNTILERVFREVLPSVLP